MLLDNLSGVVRTTSGAFDGTVFEKVKLLFASLRGVSLVGHPQKAQVRTLLPDYHCGGIARAAKA
jgi:hypothetical protein